MVIEDRWLHCLSNFLFLAHSFPSSFSSPPLCWHPIISRWADGWAWEWIGGLGEGGGRSEGPWARHIIKSKREVWKKAGISSKHCRFLWWESLSLLFSLHSCFVLLSTLCGIWWEMGSLTTRPGWCKSKITKREYFTFSVYCVCILIMANVKKITLQKQKLN